MKRLVLALAILIPGDAIASSDRLTQGAAAIRAAGYPCSAITLVAQQGRSLRVECGRLIYLVTVKPLKLIDRNGHAR